MAVHPNPDRDKDYMYKMWGTTNLITDYWSGNLTKKELREVVGDSETIKKEDSDNSQTLFE